MEERAPSKAPIPTLTCKAAVRGEGCRLVAAQARSFNKHFQAMGVF